MSAALQSNLHPCWEAFQLLRHVGTLLGLLLMAKLLLSCCAAWWRKCSASAHQYSTCA